MSKPVPDFTVETSGVNPMAVGETKTITATVKPEIEGATVTWEVTDLDTPSDAGFATVTPNPDNQYEATVKAVKVGGGRIKATVTAGGKSASDSSRLGVTLPAPIITKDLPEKHELAPDEILDHTIEVNPNTFVEGKDTVKWFRDDVELTETELGGNYNSLNIVIYAENSNKRGTYQAKLTNATGTTESKKMVVTVAGD